MHTSQPVVEITGHLSAEELTKVRTALDNAGVIALRSDEISQHVVFVEAVQLAAIQLGELGRLHSSGRSKERGGAFLQAARTLDTLLEHVGRDEE